MIETIGALLLVYVMFVALVFFSCAAIAFSANTSRNDRRQFANYALRAWAWPVLLVYGFWLMIKRVRELAKS